MATIEEELRAEIKRLQAQLVAMDEEIERMLVGNRPVSKNIAYVPMDGKLVPVQIRSWRMERHNDFPVYVLGRDPAFEYVYPGATTIHLEGAIIAPYNAKPKELAEAVRNPPEENDNDID